MTRNRIIAIFITIAIALIGVFVFLTFRPVKSVTDTSEISEIEKLIVKNIENDYPATPREVVKLYNRYLQAIYDADTTDDQIRQLLEKQRGLYDTELLGVNPFETNYAGILEEVADYRKNERIIVNSTVSGADEVIYKRLEGKNYALIDASYFMRTSGGNFSKTYETYMLRKDEDGKWRILGFAKA